MVMSFSQQVAAFAKKTNSTIDETVSAIRVQILGAVIRRTPVDSGRAQGAWIATTGSPSSIVGGNVPDQPRKPEGMKTEDFRGISGNKSVNEAIEIAESQPDSIFYLTNNLPYISRLEYDPVGEGGSKQAPAGMVRVSLMEFKSGLKELLK